MSVTVSGGVGTSTYQWQSFTSGTWSNIASATNSTYATVFTQLGSFDYRVIVTQGIGCQTVSDPFTIEVIDDPEATITPSATTACTGAMITIVATVNGATGSSTYQWQQFISGSWTNVGPNNDTFVTPSLTNGTYNYRLLFSQGSGCTDESNSVSIQVVNDPTVSITGDNLICEGESVVLSSNVSGGAPPFVYHWQVQQGANWVDAGSTPTTFNTGPLAAGTHNYRLFLENSAGCNATSNTISINSASYPTVTVSAVANPVCAGGVSQMSGTVTGGFGTNTYQWQNYNGTIWVNVGSNNANYAVSLPVGTHEYRLIVTQSSGCVTISASYFMVVNPDATVTATADNPSICIGGTAIVTANVTGGTPNITYQWQSGTGSGGPWTNISGATSSTYAVPSGSASSLWYRVVTNDITSGCADPTSNAVQVVVVADPTITATGMDDIFCLGEPINMSVTVTGGSGTPNYQWQYYDGTDWINTGTNSSSFNPGALSAGSYQYRAVVTQNSGCEGVSGNINFSVLEYPVASLASAPASCGDDEGTITITFSDDPLATSIQISLDGGATYFPAIPDNQGSATYTDLAPGMYAVWAKWAPDECAIFVGEIEVEELPCGDICGNVSDDTGNPIGNVEIKLYVDNNDNDVYDSGETLLATLTTNTTTGDYCFLQYPAGEYVVVQTQPANYNSISDYDHTTAPPDTDGYAGGSDPDNMIPVTLTVGESDEDNNFIEDPLTGSISGFVRNEINGPISGVVINLYLDTDSDGLPNGASIANTFSNGSGAYSFTGVEPGTYVLVETNLPNYSDISDYDETTSPPDTDGNDSAEGPDNNIPVVLTAAETDADNIFKDGRPGDICGNVSNDLNLPLSNVEIQLHIDVNNNDSLDVADIHIATTYTDGDTGDYCFDDVQPGEYVIYEIQPTAHSSISDYDHTTNAPDTDGGPSADDPDNEIPVTLLPNENDNNNDFIEDPDPGLISGYVWNDIGNPLNAISIALYPDPNADGYQDGAPLATTTTNTSGFYSFSGVEPGYYVVVETNLPGYGDVSDYDYTTTPPDTDGNDSGQGPDNNIPVFLLPGELDQDNNFTDSRPGSICGNVSDDTGLPISGVEIMLYLDVNNNDSLDVADVWVATTFTDGDTGDYCFDNIPPVEYVVVETQPPFYTSVSDYDHTTNAPDTDGYASADDPDNEIPVTLMPTEVDANNNFIEDPFAGSITGFVHNDAGAPIQGITIKLYNDNNADGIADGAAIGTIVTNSSGAYAFTGVEPGYYVVIETTPLFHSSISDYDHTTAPPDLDGNDSGQGPDDDIPVLLMPGEADADNNFVDGRPGDICGTVSDDTGLPISSVEIQLYHDLNNNDSLDVADTLVATTFTDGDTGDYCFENVMPGEYVVFEVQPLNYYSVSDYDHSTNAPDTDGYASGDDPDDEIPVTLMPNENDYDNDFIEDPFTGTISGHIENEIGTPMNNVQVRLYKDTNADGNPDGPIQATATTNSSGNYTFSGVEMGYYVLVQVTPFYHNNISDYDHSTAPPDTDGDDSAQGPDANIPVFLSPGEDDEDNNFINGRPGKICGSVNDDTGLYVSDVEIRLYLDVNNNDMWDAGDILVATTFTDGDTGNYIFEDIAPGEYVIVEIQPTNYTNVSDYDHTTTPPDTDGDDSADGWDNEIPVTLTPNEQDCGNQFIEDPIPGSIAGKVENETGAALAGVTISLYNDTNADGIQDGAPIATTVTNVSGLYSFSGIEPGFYVVVETNPDNYTSISDYDHTTTPPDTDGNDSGQGPDDNIPVKLLAGETDADNNFIDGSPGLICGNVNDDAGLPLANIELQLYHDINNNDSLDVADTLVATVFSAAGSGNYCFEDIAPGEYVIFQIQPANYYSVSDYDVSTSGSDNDGQPSADDPDDEIAVTLDPDELDAGNNFVEDPFTGIISGSVRNDLNNGMPGVTIKLYLDTNGDGNPDGSAIATTSTNGSGNYTFNNVEPGTYVIVETSPFYHFDISDYDHTTTTPDTDGDDTAEGADNNIPVILTPGETDSDNIFLEGRPGTICGTVSDSLGLPMSSIELMLYADVNSNGMLDAGDTLVYTVFSDGDTGNYCFENVTPGDYIIVETQPTDYYSVSDYDESITGSDPDGDDQADGPDDEIPVTVAFGENDYNNDFIDEPIPGSISGYVLDEVDGPIVGVTIYLYKDTNGDGNEDGSPIDTMLTNSSGYYAFTGVRPDKYVVVEVQPANHSSISDIDTTTVAPDLDGNDFGQGPDNDIPVTLMPAEDDEDNIFVDGRPGKICGYIENDLGEVMGGMVVQLYVDLNGNGQINPGDTMVTFMFTDSITGGYCFLNVMPGNYIVNEVQPDGYGDESDMDETPDPDGDDSGEGPDNNIPVTVNPFEDDMDNIFKDIVCPGLPEITGMPFDTICSGDAIVFEAVNPGAGTVSYAWNFGSGSVPGAAGGIGPHTVTYISNGTNSTIGASVVLTINKAGCTAASDTVATILVNPIPNPTIDASTSNLCYYATRVFKPVAAYVPGYTYAWNFGAGAEPATATGYGPHTVEWHTTGVKTVELIIQSNAPGSNCIDTGTLVFNVIQCVGSITGKVQKPDGNGIINVNVRLFPDNNLDGVSDGGAPIKSVFTNAAGIYVMTAVLPGQYVIVETQPTNYNSVSEEDITNDSDTLSMDFFNDNVIPTTVEPNEVDADNIFIDSPSPGMITGFVFEDLDSDDIPDTGEGIDSVVIQLYTDNDANGIPDTGGFIADTITSATGAYTFTNLTPANYVLVQLQPDGYLSVKDIDPTPDNDAVPNTNITNDTIPVTVSPAENDANNYFIEVIGCTNVVTNTADSGPGSLRYVIDCAEEGDTITFHTSLWNQTIHLTSTLIEIDKDLHIHSSLTAPRIMIHSDVMGAFRVLAGYDVEMKNIEITSGLEGVQGVAIENHGTLTLWDVCVFKNPLLTLPSDEYLIYNGDTSEMFIKGACHIEE
jgi:protocatechuate 3,4-dioxygenase beta subunit